VGQTQTLSAEQPDAEQEVGWTSQESAHPT
jgi:hypothetical protein